MKKFIGILITLLIFGLWILSAYMYMLDKGNDVDAWLMLYIPIMIITWGWLFTEDGLEKFMD